MNEDIPYTAAQKSADNSVEGKVKKEPPEKHGCWECVPFLSAAAFLLILLLYGNFLGLGTFSWDVVESNLRISQSNSVSVAELRVTNNVSRAMGASTDTTGSESGENPADRVTKDLIGRIFWGISAVVFAFLCLWTIYISIRISKTVCKSDGKITRLWISGLAAVYIAVFCVELQNLTTLSGGSAADQLLEAIKKDGMPISGLLVPESIHAIRILVGCLTAGAVTGLISVALAACFLVKSMKELAVTMKEPAVNWTDAADLFENRVSTSLSLLQLTAAALVAGVLEVYFLYTMASYHKELILQNDVQYFARGAATAIGSIYTVMLAAIFFPLAAVQRDTGRKILQQHEVKLDPELRKRLQDMTQADVTALPVIRAGLVILSPLLASLLTKLFGTITGHF